MQSTRQKRVHGEPGAVTGDSKECSEELSVRLCSLLAMGVRVFSRCGVLLAEASDGRALELRDVPVRLEEGRRGLEEEIAVLTPQQQRLWLFEEGFPGTDAYNVPRVLRLEGRIVLSHLSRALATVVDRHAALRSRIACIESLPLAVISPTEPVRIPVVDLTGLPRHRRSIASIAALHVVARRPFDLRTGPLFVPVLVAETELHSYLALVAHHIVYDEHSHQVVLEELEEVYRAQAEGRAPTLAEVTDRSGEAAARERMSLDSEEGRRLVEFWRSELKGSFPEISLPVDRKRPSLPRFRGGRVEISLPEDLAEQMGAGRRAHRATRYILSLAGFVAVLGRYAGQERFNLGTARNARVGKGQQRAVGFHVDNVVLPIDLRGEPSFAELVKRIKETSRRVFRHQSLPLDLIVAELASDLEISGGRMPLFQVLFHQLEAAPRSLDLPGAVGHSVNLSRLRIGSAKFDLTLTSLRADGRSVYTFDFDADLFDRTTIQRMAKHCLNLLRAGLSSPETSVFEIPMLDLQEEHQILREWNDTTWLDPSALTVTEAFELVAAARPEAVAAVSGFQHLSYGELDRRANRLAHSLRSMGVFAGSAVGLLCERSIERAVALLGILKAGGAYVPLDPDYPSGRLQLMIERAAVSVILVDRPESAVVTQLGAAGVERRLPPVRRLDACPAGAATGSWSMPPAGPREPNALAYVMFTSGSTGEPKGVAVPHRGIVRLTIGANYVDLGPEQTVLHFASISFDASTFEIWGALLTGGRLVIAPPGPVGVRELASVLRAHRVSVLWLTAGLFHEVAELEPEVLSEVEQLLAGGDVLAARHVRAVLERMSSGQSLVNGYGPTENTTFSTCHRMRPGSSPGAEVPIGRPIANSRSVVLDRTMQPLPIGVPGEMHVAGAGVAWGYVERPGATASAFVPNPLPGATPGECLYRTGDLVRWLPDGRLDFLGRVDRQYKVRGFRVEPKEIERTLLEHPGVAQAYVDVQRAVGRENRLVGYVAAERAEPDPTPSELLAFAAESLPRFMVPSAIFVLPNFPLTRNGKIDRRVLRALEPEPPAPRSAAEPSPIEEVLAAIWAETLDLQQVGLDQGFFELGGHSLLGMRVLHRVEQAFGVAPRLADLMERPTVHEFERVVSRYLEGGESVSSLPPPERDTTTVDVAPVSNGQKRLWTFDCIHPDLQVYNIPIAVALEGRVLPIALAAALRDVVRRHEVLRSSLEAHADGPVQRIRCHSTIPALTWIDLSALPVRCAGGEARAAASQMARRPIDLAAQALWRAGLIVRVWEPASGVKRADLVLVIHHAIFDGWSETILFRELTAAYRARSEDRLPSFEPLPIQFSDYARWQHRYRRHPAVRESLELWKRRLGSTPPVCELPTDRPRPSSPSLRGRRRRLTLDRGTGDLVSRLAREADATQYIVLLAAFAAVLGRFTGRDVVTLGTPVAGRTQPKTEGLVGFFVNMVVLRGDLGCSPSFRELIRRLRGEVLRAWAHQDVPFDRLVEELAPDRDLGHSPLFQIAFALERRSIHPFESVPGLVSERIAVHSGTSKFDLTLTVEEAPGTLGLSAEYATELFDDTTVERFLRSYRCLLNAALESPHRRVGELPLLGPSNVHQTTIEWNHVAGKALEETTVTAHLREVVRRFPDAVAVVQGERHVSYAELDRRAGRLADRIRNRAGQGDRPIGVLGGRSVEGVVAIVGILQAGGAYLPLDPNLPEARLRFMVEDAGAVAIVVTEGMRENGGPEGTGFGAGVLRFFIGEDGVVEPSGPSGRSGAFEGPAGAPQSTAYINYTSGSTGRPKGIAIPHRAIGRLVLGTNYLRIDRDDRVVHASTLVFDAATFELWGALLNGAALEIVPRDLVLAPQRLARRLSERRATVMFVTTALFNEIVRTAPSAFSTLRALLFGGEEVDPGRVRDLLSGEPPDCVLHVYGPTEATTFSTWHRIERAPKKLETIPIGGPLTTMELFVVDVELRPVPVGVTGELLVGGPGLARCYCGRSGLTAARFVPHPFSRRRGDRLYRTGDLAHWTPDGEIVFDGRADHQVKVRGFRIELGEVEGAIAAHPAIHSAAVSLLREGGRRVLVGYLVPKKDTRPDLDAVRDHLRSSLPDYMVPAALVLVETLPLTPSGKIDRRALPAPGRSAFRAQGFLAPRSPVERTLAEIWARSLGLKNVGIRDNFFALGGDSLLTILVARRAGERGLELSAADLFRRQTIEELATVVTARRPAGAQTPITGPVPLLPVQLWFFSYGRPRPEHFNIPTLLEVPRGGWGTYRRAILDILRHHDALRLRFHREPDGSWRQECAAPINDAPFIVVDLSSVPGGVLDRQMERVASDAHRSVDLARGPVVRACLFDFGAGRGARLLLVVHHLVADGYSLGIVLEDLARAWRCRREGRVVDLPRKTTSFLEWARRLERRVESGALHEQLAYWAMQPWDRYRRPPVEHPEEESLTAGARLTKRALEPEVMERLSSGEHGHEDGEGDVLATVLAALARAYGQWSGQDHLIVNVVGHGREDRLEEGVDLSRTVGWLNTLYPVALPLRGVEKPRETLKRVREILRSVPERGLGFGLLCYCDRSAKVRRVLETIPLPEINVNYLGRALGRLIPEDSPFRAATGPTGQAQDPGGRLPFTITIFVALVGGQLELWWNYNARVVQPETIERLSASVFEEVRRLAPAAASAVP